MPHCIYEDPKDILTFFDIEEDRLLTDGIVLIFFFFGMRLLAFLALKIKVLLILYENTRKGFYLLSVVYVWRVLKANSITFNFCLLTTPVENDKCTGLVRATKKLKLLLSPEQYFLV